MNTLKKQIVHQSHNHNYRCKDCEINFTPINNKIEIIKGKYIMTNKRGVRKKWMPNRFFNHILKVYEGRKIVIKIDIVDLGEINETQ